MKKRSLWMLLLAALLCLSMLFAACDSEDIEETSESDTTEETQAPVEPETEARPVDVVVNQASNISDWKSYFYYSAKESNKTAYTSMNELFYVDDADEDNTTISYYEDIDICVVTKINTENNSQIKTITLYNLKTGAQILSKAEQYDANFYGKTVSYDVSVSDDYIILTEEIVNTDTFATKTYQYCISFNGTVLAAVEQDMFESFTCNKRYDSFIEVKVNKRVSSEPSNMEMVTTYSYYDKAGNALATNLSSEAEIHYYDWDYYNGSFVCLRIEGRNYYFCNGEIIFINEDRTPTAIPLEFGNYFEALGKYNGYNYYVYGNTVQVVDPATCTVIASHTIPSQDSPEYYSGGSVNILANGNVYIHLYNNDDIIFDSEYVDGNTYSRYSAILDITTGKTTIVDDSFIMLRMLTPASLESGNMRIVSDYNYAEILPIKDGKISTETEFVILNSNLETVKVLPKFVKNQSSLETMIGTGQFVVSADDVLGNQVMYLANGNTGTVTPYWNGESYISFENGFVVREYEYDDIMGSRYDRYLIYNVEMEKLAEITSMQYPRFEAGKVIFSDTSTVKIPDYNEDPDDKFVNDETEEEEQVTYKIGYIDSYGQWIENTLYGNSDIKRVEFTSSVNNGKGAIWTSRYEDRSSEVEDYLYIYNAYGQQIQVLTGMSDPEAMYCGENAVIVRSTNSDGNATYYIIK